MSEQRETVDSQDENPLFEGVEPISTCLADVEAKEVEWLWPGRMPLGKLSLILGYPDVGKSMLTTYMAATVTTGRPWPDLPAEPSEKGSVILLTAEDDLSDTVKPRMDAAGVDPKKVNVLQYIKRIKDAENGQESFRLTGNNHLVALYKLIKKLADVRLIIIDPLTAYVGKIDSHKNADVRSVLFPLCKLAEEVEAAIVCVIHPNKNDAVKAIHRATGSAAFVEAARAVWMVVKDKNDRHRKLFVPSKTNLSRNPASMAFRIVDVPGDGGKVASCACEFEPEAFYMDADEALEGTSTDKRTQKPALALDRASVFLTGYLADGPKESKQVIKAARKHGIRKSTLKDARKRAGVRPDKKGVGKDSHWELRLPTKDERFQDAMKMYHEEFEKAIPSKSTGSS